MPFKAPKLSKRSHRASGAVDQSGRPDSRFPDRSGRGKQSSGSCAPEARRNDNSSNTFVPSCRPSASPVMAANSSRPVSVCRRAKHCLRAATTAQSSFLERPTRSLLVKKIRHEHEPGMPLKRDKLPEAVISQIVSWVNAGVPYDRPLELTPAADQITSLHPGSKHWAFQPVKRPPLPKVKNQAWVRNPIDAFVAAQAGGKEAGPARGR